MSNLKKHWILARAGRIIRCTEILRRRFAEAIASSRGDESQQVVAAPSSNKLATFLHNPKVGGTNNAVERALRPAVVMRKITGGSRSASAAEAWAILASIMRTAGQQGRDVLATIKTLLKAAWAGKDIALLTDLF